MEYHESVIKRDVLRRNEVMLRYKLESAYMRLINLHQWPDRIVACRGICEQECVKEFAIHYGLEIVIDNAIQPDQFQLRNSDIKN